MPWRELRGSNTNTGTSYIYNGSDDLIAVGLELVMLQIGTQETSPDVPTTFSAV